MRMRTAALAAILTIATVACSGPAEEPSASAPPPSPQASSVPSATASDAAAVSPSPDVLTTPTIDGSFAVADGRKLAIRCWGEGAPTVVLVGGHPSEGIADFEMAPAFLRPLAERTRTCAYARSGYPGSDPAPNEPRDADDVIGDLDDLLTSAAVNGPYVLVGQSFGGMLVAYHAARFPEDVAGVVLLDTPAPDASLTLEQIPEIAWDHPANPEHTDTLAEFEHRFAQERLPIQAPLTVVTATSGASSVEDQSVWLDISPNANQVELAGGHDIHLADPVGAASEVLKMVDASR